MHEIDPPSKILCKLRATEDVDLIAIFLVLLAAKKRVLISTFFFVFIGFCVSFLLPQKWTSKSIVTPAEPAQWGQVLQMLVPLKTLGVNVDIDRDDIFNNFLKQFSSQQVLEEYISSSPQLMASFRKSNADAMELRRNIVSMSEKMKAVNNNTAKKGDSSPYSLWTLRFTGANPQEARSILNNYIEFVAAKVVAQFLEGVRDALTLKVETEKDELALERTRLAIIQDTKIKRLNYSLQVAKAAGIARPVYSNGQAVKDDPDFSIALGADGIARKLEIEKSITDMAELTSELRNRYYQLSLLEKINVRDMTFPVFKYQQPAALPVEMDGPGTAMIVVLAALTGGLLSCGWALFSEALALHPSQIAPPKAC